MSTPATPAAPRPLGGIAFGVALVLIAVFVGVVGQRAADGGAGTATTTKVAATGRTTTVEVTAKDMRFHPDTISVPAGDKLVVKLVNADQRHHDLVLANGKRTPHVEPGRDATLDAGVVSGTVDGWCSLPGHRQAGMVLTVTTTGGTDSADGHGEHDHSAEAPPAKAGRVDPMADPGAGFTARDATLPPAPAERVHKVTLRAQEVDAEVAPGVRQKLWTFGGTTPGPVLRGKVGDVFEITLVNDGTVDHGIDFHAGALAPDKPMRPIAPGESLVYRFTATKAGVWMYHCSTMPMLYHIGNGMYGAVVIDPPDLAPVAKEYVLVQSELYLGPDGQPGDLTKMREEKPDAVVFNGYVSQYAHRPLAAKAGERVRVWLLDAGPSRSSSFHVVGAQFDTVYEEGAYRLRPGAPGGAQVLDLAPAAGGFVEMVFPEAGTYPFVTHAMVDADRGARGAFNVG